MVLSLALVRPAMRPIVSMLATQSRLVASAAQPVVTRDASRGGMITIAPAEGHSATFVGPIHGLGDTNMGWADVAALFHSKLPYVKFVLPNAPVSPVTLNGGMAMPSWYDIASLDDRAKQPCNGIEESTAVIQALIDEEIEAGIPANRIVVGGFSQGGAMSLFAGLSYPATLAGVCVMSGYLAKAEAFTLAPAAASTPVGHFHGVLDPTVKIQWARASAEEVRKTGVLSYELKEYDDLAHSAHQEEIEDVAEWLEGRLPPL